MKALTKYNINEYYKLDFHEKFMQNIYQYINVTHQKKNNHNDIQCYKIYDCT